MESQEHSADAVREIALDALTADGFPYTVAQDALNALAAKGITLAGPGQVAVSGEAVTELIEFIDEHDPDDDRMTRSIWDALAELRAALGAGPERDDD